MRDMGRELKAVGWKLKGESLEVIGWALRVRG